MYDKSQLMRGTLEGCILKILSQNTSYGYEIVTTLLGYGFKDIKEGTIYPLLTRLKNDGLLNYRWEESTSGPPRKYYGLTELGKTFLKELSGTWTELSDAVTIITNQN